MLVWSSAYPAFIIKYTKEYNSLFFTRYKSNVTWYKLWYSMVLCKNKVVINQKKKKYGVQCSVQRIKRHILHQKGGKIAHQVSYLKHSTVPVRTCQKKVRYSSVQSNHI
jgi:protease II